MNNIISILDSTLRDGAQAEGISFSVEDKLNIIISLDRLGVEYIEAGNPGANPKDIELFNKLKNIKLKNAKIVSFGSTRRKYISTQEDENLNALLSAQTEYVSIFGKCSKNHVLNVICADEAENYNMIMDSCRFLKDNNRKVFFDAEHFFEGFKDNPDFALKMLNSAIEGGCDYIILCDTNGGTFPEDIFDITKSVVELFDIPIGIHTHNDNGLAVANSLAAVRAGARQVQGTYLGFGERCGNANLSTIIPSMQLKLGYRCIPKENINLLTTVARRISEISNISLNKSEPYVGMSAFAHKAGMHADGVLKIPSSFEHIDPYLIGNKRRFLMSEISGKKAVYNRVKDIYPEIKQNSKEIESIIKDIKEKELIGYQFEGADGSFELLVRKQLGIFEEKFKLISYKIITFCSPVDSDGSSAQAIVKVDVNGKKQLMAAEGNGPINALDKALRKALEIFFPELSQVRLIDYKVRVVNPNMATAATVRVLIVSTDGKRIWTTVGASGDVVKASWLALKDSIEYKLICKDN